MNRDNSDVSTTAFPVLSVFRGLYRRVAAKLGVDPSFVSRVARGERRSPAVLAALREEMSVIREHLNKLDENFGADGQTNGQQKDGEISNGELRNGNSLDGHSRERDGYTKNGALNAGELVDGHLQDGHASGNSRDALPQTRPGKLNSKSIKSRQNNSKRNDGAQACK